MSGTPDDVLARELAYHEKLYSGFAQSHFARPAVRALRAHMAKRILKATGAGRDSRVLSLGCGIGDTELLIAPHVREIVGVDLSPTAIRQARVSRWGVWAYATSAVLSYPERKVSVTSVPGVYLRPLTPLAIPGPLTPGTEVTDTFSCLTW